MNNNITRYENGIDFEVEPIDKPSNLEKYPSHEPIIDWGPMDISMVNQPTADDCLIQTNPSSMLSINGENNDMLVNVHKDGTIKFGPNYNPSAAAKTFWECLGEMSPQNKAIKDMEELVKIQCSEGNYNYSEYMWGMANGLILALAVLKDEEPSYLDRPQRWLCNSDKHRAPSLGAVAACGTRPECSEEDPCQEVIDYCAYELCKIIDEEIINELKEEIEKITADDYERAMNGL